MFQKTVLSLAVAGVLLGVGFPATVWAADDTAQNAVAAVADSARTSNATDSLSAPIPNDPKLVQGTLPNGLRYMIYPNATPEKRAELQLVVRAGSLNETDEQSGMAHFTEHMLFNGTAHYPKNTLVSELKRLGVNFGAELNAYTSFDKTVYILPIPLDNPDNLKTGLQVLNDWAFHATLDDEAIEGERNIIHEEWRKNQTNPASRQVDKIYSELGEGTILGKRLPIGNQDIVLHGKPQLIKDFYHTWYRPDNMTVLVAGDVDVVQTEAMIKDLFTAAKNPNSKAIAPVVAPQLTQEPKVTLIPNPELSQSSVELMYYQPQPAQSITRVDEYLLMKKRFMLQNILAERLRQTILSAKSPVLLGFNPDANADTVFPERHAFWWGAGVVKGQELSAVRLINENLQSVFTQGIRPDELNRVIQNELTQMDSRYQQREKTYTGERMGQMMSRVTVPNAVPTIEWERQIVQQYIPKITADELTQLAREIYQPQLQQVIMIGNFGKEVDTASVRQALAQTTVKDNRIVAQVAAPTEAAITQLLPKMPTPGRITNTQVDNAMGLTTWTLSNGALVSFKKTDLYPDQVLLSMVSDGGFSLVDNATVKKVGWGFGLAGESGFNGYTSTQLAQFNTGKKYTISATMSDKHQGLQGSFSPRDGEYAMQTVYMTLTGLNNDKDAFERALARIRSDVQSIADNDMNVFSQKLQAHLDKHNPRFNGAFPTVENLKPIDYAQIRALYQRAFGNARGMHFYLVGAIDEAQLREWVQNYIASLPAKAAPTRAHDWGYGETLKPETFVVHQGKKTGYVKMIWARPVKYDVRTLFATGLATSAAADVLNVKLTEQVREKFSDVYHINSGFMQNMPPRAHQIGMIDFPCNPANAQAIVLKVQTVLNQVKAEGGISEQDLANFKKAQHQQYELGLKNNGYWLNNFVNAQVQGYKASEMLKVPQYIDALTVADVQKVLREITVKAPFVGVLKPEGK